MMKNLILAASAVAALAASPALAQTSPPSGGPGAKGNAPLKQAHTVNDGGAKRGANSFTEGQARRHIEHAGYTAVSPLTKGSDGVWRGTATKNGASVAVGLDFKGNVSEGGPGADAMAGPAAGPAPGGDMASGGAGGPAMPAGPASAPAATGNGASAMAHHRRHHRRHHRHMGRCAHPGANGAACSGVDRNHNGISDKEDRAINSGSRP